MPAIFAISKFAPLVTAAALLCATVPARALDTSAYAAGPAVAVLVSGDPSPILLSPMEVRQSMMLYAMNFTVRVNFLWSDRMTMEWSDRALQQAIAIVAATHMKQDKIDRIGRDGYDDATAFAARYGYDSNEAQALLRSLAFLIARG